MIRNTEVFRKTNINELSERRYLVSADNDIELEFTTDEVVFLSLQLFLEKVKFNCRGNLILQLIDLKEDLVVMSEMLPLYKLNDKEWTEIEFEPILNVEEKTYKLILSVDDKDGIYVYGNEDGIASILTSQIIQDSVKKTILKGFEKLNEVKSLKGWKFVELYESFQKKIDKIYNFLGNYSKQRKNKYEMLKGKREKTEYEQWLQYQEENIVLDCSNLKEKPLISVLTTTFNTSKNYLREVIDSVLNQTYDNFELIIVDGGSDKNHVKKILEEYKAKDSRIKLKFLETHMGIAENINMGLEEARGDYIACIYHEDFLDKNALYRMVEAINENNKPELIYADDDMFNDRLMEFKHPQFKPDYSIDMLRSFNYFGYFTFVRKDILDEFGSFDPRFDGCDNYNLYLKITEKYKNIVHVPSVLYHKRDLDVSSFYSFEGGIRALREHLQRSNIEGEVFKGTAENSYRIEYKLKENSKVSIVMVNNKDEKYLEASIKSLYEKTTYTNFEFILVSDEAQKENIEKTIEKLDVKNAELVFTNGLNISQSYNAGIKKTSGEFVVLMDSDIEIDTATWAEDMIQYAQREDVAFVGSKTYYLDNSIQNAGFIVGANGIYGKVHEGQMRWQGGYMERLKVSHNLSAVSMAFTMVRREVIEALGNFDENFNSELVFVNLCLKAREVGYNIVMDTNVETYKYCMESKNEISDEDIELFKEKNNNILEDGDPYYNRNFILEDASFKVKKVETSNTLEHTEL